MIKSLSMVVQSQNSFHQSQRPFDSSLYLKFEGNGSYPISLGRIKVSCISIAKCNVLDRTDEWHEESKANFCDYTDSNPFLEVQTLRNFPFDKLYGKVAMVRFDHVLLLSSISSKCLSVNRAFSTINYLHNAGCKILLVSNWDGPNCSVLPTQSVADYLSSILQIKVEPLNGFSLLKEMKIKEMGNEIFLLENLSKFKEEVANCSEFSEKLSSGVEIFVNDAFSLSHKALSSTVGVARFCYASLAGFHFEAELVQLMKIPETTMRPYLAIIGGSNFSKKASALHTLASTCDGMIFAGMLAFQVMSALGIRVPARFVERNAVEEAIRFVQHAYTRDFSFYLPKDFLCSYDDDKKIVDIFPSDEILAGWTPIDLGPESLMEFSSVLSKCKKVLWIGPVKFGLATQEMRGASELATSIDCVSSSCDIIVVGDAAKEAVARVSSTISSYKIFENASVVWEFLKGQSMPGIAALDRAYPSVIDWSSIFADPIKPLIIDIGSGNGLFILGMAKKCKHQNFIGLEINKKLVKRCLDNAVECNIKNGYFFAANATSTFRSIVSSYPGNVALVSIQCPNPDFNKGEHRWRMVQRALIEAIIDLLSSDGKIFLQSDIKGVTLRMKKQFLLYGEGKLVLEGGDSDGWLKENPFGVRSDWENHVLDRGAPMFRVMLRKIR